MVRFDFVELFAGIGGFRLALEAVGGRCVLASEYSQHACAVYRRNWPNDPVLVGDVPEPVLDADLRALADGEPMPYGRIQAPGPNE